VRAPWRADHEAGDFNEVLARSARALMPFILVRGA
jgi:hypothetical protein